MEQTWAQSLIAEGIEKGIEKGQVDAAQRMLLRQLTAKFGRLPEATEIRVRAIRDQAKLDDVAVQLLSAASLEELGL